MACHDLGEKFSQREYLLLFPIVIRGVLLRMVYLLMKDYRFLIDITMCVLTGIWDEHCEKIMR